MKLYETYDEQHHWPRGFDRFDDIITEIIEVTDIITSKSPKYEYHKRHVKLMEIYLSYFIPYHFKLIIPFVSNVHDILKERHVDAWNEWVNSPGYNEDSRINMPTDLKEFIKSPEAVKCFEELQISQYVSEGSISDHAAGSTAWLYINYGDRLKAIGDDASDGLKLVNLLIAFHSSAIKNIYDQLDDACSYLCDVVMLSDKLSSNHIRIHESEDVRTNIHALVFDEDSDPSEDDVPSLRSHNGDIDSYHQFDVGILAAKLIGAGKHPNTEEQKMIKLYADRLRKGNPFIKNQIDLKTLGGKHKWPRRRNRLLTGNSWYLKEFWNEEDTQDTQ